MTTDFAFVEVMDPIEKSFGVKSCITWFRTKSNFSKRQAKFFSPILVTTEVSNDFLYLRLKKRHFCVYDLFLYVLKVSSQ